MNSFQIIIFSLHLILSIGFLPHSVGQTEIISMVKCLKDGESSSSTAESNKPIAEVCCEGYERSADSKCIPICNTPCTNAFCSSPNYCECFANHTRDESNNCIPTCPLGCLNGKCFSNGTCECNNGYLLQRNKKFCRPFCSEGCPSHLTCSSPGQCTCHTGYSPDENGICSPICVENCLSGNCTAPNICSCFPGFSIKNGVCQAKCENDCKNGKCIFPDVCICDPGYTYNTDSSECDPVCRECENGNCIGPENCSCNEGYVQFEKSCKPFCIGECDNGYCIAPYQCICKDGYGKNPSGSCMVLNCKTGFTEKECTIYHS